jgi:HEAT repeat protein
MNANDIDRLLETSLHGAVIAEQLKREAPDQELVAALQRVSDLNTRQLLHYVIGERKIQTAVPLLIEHLSDSNAKIRYSAADALGAIGDPRSGNVMFNRFAKHETDQGVRTMLAAALGAVEYEPAVPALMEALTYDGPEGLRGTAAWALGKLQAREALSALEEALQREQDAYSHERIFIAIGQILNADL